MIRLVTYLLSFILFFAGLLHGLMPSLFLVAMPPYVPFHYEVVLMTGILEIALAAGLYFPYSRKAAGLVSALYFIAILPAHFHVSINGIPMFGVTSPFLLWTRTALQSLFISWGLLIYKKG